MSMPAHAQPSLLRESCLSPISFFSWREATSLVHMITIFEESLKLFLKAYFHEFSSSNVYLNNYQLLTLVKRVIVWGLK